MSLETGMHLDPVAKILEPRSDVGLEVQIELFAFRVHLTHHKSPNVHQCTGNFLVLTATFKRPRLESQVPQKETQVADLTLEYLKGNVYAKKESGVNRSPHQVQQPQSFSRGRHHINRVLTMLD